MSKIPPRPISSQFLVYSPACWYLQIICSKYIITVQKKVFGIAGRSLVSRLLQPLETKQEKYPHHPH